MAFNIFGKACAYLHKISYRMMILLCNSNMFSVEFDESMFELSFQEVSEAVHRPFGHQAFKLNFLPKRC